MSNWLKIRLAFVGMFLLCVGICLWVISARGQSWPPAVTYMSDAQIQAMSTLCGKPAPVPNEPLPKKEKEDSFVPCVELRMFYRQWCEE
jgi:hypothetical protein